jgi:flagellar motor switch protein FliG
MSAGPHASTNVPKPRPLTGAERVAVLLLALGKDKAAHILKRFGPEELRLLTRSTGDLRPVSSSDLESLIEEFASMFSTGVNFVSSMQEVESLLAGVMSEDQIAEVKQDEPEAEEEPVWDSIGRVKDEVVLSYLLNEHLQTTALILTKIDSGVAARIIRTLDPEIRNAILRRMLSIKQVSEEALRAIQSALRDDLLATASDEPEGNSRAAIADILNKLDKAQAEAVLDSLATVRPVDAKALKRMLFSFEDIVSLDQKARSVLFDKVPMERVVLAVNGAAPELQAAILSALGARARRMVEAELQGGAAAPARDVAEARRSIVDTVLQLIAQGAITLAEDEAEQPAG